MNTVPDFGVGHDKVRVLRITIDYGQQLSFRIKDGRVSQEQTLDPVYLANEVFNSDGRLIGQNMRLEDT